MPPQAISLGLFVVEEAIKDAPELAADIQELLSKPNPTHDDWEALRAKWSKSYRDYVPDSQLPPGEGTK